MEDHSAEQDKASPSQEEKKSKSKPKSLKKDIGAASRKEPVQKEIVPELPPAKDYSIDINLLREDRRKDVLLTYRIKEDVDDINGQLKKLDEWKKDFMTK